MKTQEFIYQHKYQKEGSGCCSSVFFSDGNFYSYGRHYPLAILINDRYFVNDAGYSSTTARHISWVKKELTYFPYNYNFAVGNRKESIKSEDILDCINLEILALNKEIDAVVAKSRRLETSKKYAVLAIRRQELYLGQQFLLNLK